MIQLGILLVLNIGLFFYVLNELMKDIERFKDEDN